MMANLFYKTIIYSVLVLFSFSVQGQNKLTKEIKQIYPLTNDGALYLESKIWRYLHKTVGIKTK